MAEPPGPVAKLDLYLRAARIAHETIWSLHEALTTRDLSDSRTRARVRESARIAAVELPRISAEARRLQGIWSEQELLAPPAAEETLRALSHEFNRIEPDLRRMRARQREVARELRDLLGDAER